MQKIIKKKSKENSEIFFTGGLGDVIALESFMSNHQREIIETIFYATRKHKNLKLLFSALNLPKLKNHIVTWEDYKFWCFFRKEEYLSILKKQKKEISKNLEQSEDWSIYKKFSEINNNIHVYNNSTFISNKLTDIHKYNFNNYICVCPYSNDKRQRNRDFNKTDWENALNIIKQKNKKAIILNEINEYIPECDAINLSGKINLLESIEILKKADGYIGIDSCLSVIAAKLFNENDLIIKSQNRHCFDNKHIYYAPHKSFSFLKKTI